MHRILSKSTKSKLLALWLLAACTTTSDKKASIIDETYQKKHDAFQKDLAQGRVTYLKLAGLFKLDTDMASMGADPNAHFPLSIEGIPESIGFFSLEGDDLFFTSSDNVEVIDTDGNAQTRVQLTIDSYGNSQKLKYDQAEWRVITRGGDYYVRVWDHQNPAIKSFQGFGFYDLNPDMIFEGKFTYFSTAQSNQVDSQLGVEESVSFIGQVSFTYQDQPYTLDVGQGGFTMVGDLTTGAETYGGGRYMGLDLPEKDSTIVLDFNTLYNPPCSFSKFTTCLYPPAQNKLPFKILAGEQYH